MLSDIVFTSGQWQVAKVRIALTYDHGKFMYFVDDLTGKNHRVFGSLEACKLWIVDQRSGGNT